MILLLESPRGIRHLWHAICFHLQVRDRWTDGRGAALHQIRLALQPTAEDRAWIQLPQGLESLYLVVRPLRKLIEGLQRSPKKPVPSWRSEASSNNASH